MRDQGAEDRIKVDPAVWVPGAAWAVFLGLSWAATSLGAGVYTTAVLALVPFGLFGALLRRARFAVVITAVLGLMLLTVLSTALDAVGLQPGAAAGATAVACLALPLGAAIGNYRRHQRTKATRPAPPKPPKAPRPAQASATAGRPPATATGDRPPARAAAKASPVKPVAARPKAAAAKRPKAR